MGPIINGFSDRGQDSPSPLEPFGSLEVGRQTTWCQNPSSLFGQRPSAIWIDKGQVVHAGNICTNYGCI
jgi:hypothetical protein